MSEVLFVCPYGAIFSASHLCLSSFDPKINEQLPVPAANMGLDITVCYDTNVIHAYMVGIFMFLGVCDGRWYCWHVSCCCVVCGVCLLLTV